MPRHWFWVALVAVVLASGLGGHAVIAQDANEASSADFDPTLPEGGSEALMEYIEKVESLRPSSDQQSSREALYQFIRDTRAAIVAAADKILATPAAEGDEGDADRRVSARIKKVEAMALLIQAQAPGALEALRNYAAELRKEGETDLADTAEVQLLVRLIRGMVLMEGSERAKQYEEIRGILKQAPKNRMYIGVAMQLIQAVEATDSTDAAANAYEEFSALYATSEDERVRAAAEQFARSARRLSLVGKPFADFEGTSVAGQPFRLQSLKDKVVLIDFWATWCGPCVAELPNVKENYEKYHDQGFEVVGISLDDDRPALEKFLAENDLPWTTLLATETKVAADQTQLPDYYGVMAIPTVILIGRDGKVISINARGEELGSLLANLLGEATAEKP